MTKTLLSTEGVKNNLIFRIKQTGNNTAIGTFDISVLYLLIDRDTAGSSSDSQCRFFFRQFLQDYVFDCMNIYI